jgi:SAM-dependent methyltransferase
MTDHKQFTLQDVARVRDYLGHSIADLSAKEVYASYIEYSLHRFLLTMEYLPDTAGRVLEIGSNPFFMTLLMKRFKPYELELANFFGETTMDAAVSHHAEIENTKYGEHHDLDYRQFNIECQAFPYADASFDGVVFCEVLEHLTLDPQAALIEINRILKPGGWLLLTTPNAAWYENIASLWLGGRSNWGPYSPFGRYGRHNREYTLPEIEQLLNQSGFTPERSEARDLHPGRRLSVRSRIIRALKPAHYHEDGLFVRATKRYRPQFARPDWLYDLAYRMTWPEHIQCQMETPISLQALSLPPAPVSSARFERRLCKTCNIEDWYGEDWLSILDDIGLGYQRNEQRRHRKAWEWVHGLYGLRRLGFLDDQTRALGVGAGKEHVIYYLANHVRRVIATDIYGEGGFKDDTAPREMLTHPQKYAPFPYRHDRLSVRHMNGRKLDFDADSFDVVFSFSSIEHFGGHIAAAEAVREMGRVLRPGGVAVISTELILNGLQHKEYFLPHEIISELVEASGLRLVEEIDFTVSERTLRQPVDWQQDDIFTKTPHIICCNENLIWTSMLMFLEKP